MTDLADIEVRCCTKCSITKPMSSFGRKGNWWCLECRREYASKWRHKNRERHRKKIKAWQEANRERVRARRQEKRKNDPHFALAERIRDKYGIRYHQYLEMLEKSEGMCAICNRNTEKLCIDHDHATGKVRELLCRSCNQGLGQFQDNPLLLSAAIQYLHKHMEVPGD